MFHRGQRVRFTNPTDAAEAAERMIVLEDRGERVLVTDELHFRRYVILPQSSYFAADLTDAE